MTPLPPRPPSNASHSTKDSSTRSGFSAWSTNQSRGSYRELSPISTSFNFARPSNSSHEASLKSPLSPVGSTTSLQSAAASGSRYHARSPSVHSPPPGITPPPGLQSSSARSRNIAAFSNNQQTSAAAASSGTGGGANSGGGGSSRGFRASPALSQSSYNPPTPTSAGGSSSSQSGSVNRIVTTQIFVLLSTLKDIDKDKAKWETEAEKIRRLVESNGMDAFEKYFRRLIVNNAGTIWGTQRNEPTGNYPMLVGEIQKITDDPSQAMKIVESIENGDADVFKDFDLSTFLEHFKMNAVSKITLASAFKKSSKSDLRTKADAIISNNIQNFLEIISRAIPAESYPRTEEDELLATVIDRLAQYPPRNWNTEMQGRLQQALVMRFENTGKAVPWTITSAFYMFNLMAANNSLLQAFKKAGQKSTETLSAAKKTLEQIERRDLQPEHIASTMLYMVITRDDPPHDLGTFVSALKDQKASQGTDWHKVIRAFDREGLTVTKEQFKRIFDALLLLAREDDQLDVQLLWGGSWTFEAAQLAFVSAFLSHTLDEIDASSIPGLRAAFTPQDFDNAPVAVQEFAKEAAHHPYASLDAITALLKLAFEDHAVYENALSNLIIERAVNTNLALFVGSASAVEARWSQVQDMAIKTLFDKILVQISRDPHSEANRDSSFALHLLWRNHQIWSINNIYKFYQQKARLQLDVILDIAQEHGMLDDLIAAKNELSLDLATLAHGRHLFDIEAWLSQISIETSSESIAPALCAFLVQKTQDEIAVRKEGMDPTTYPLSVRTAHTLLTFLGKQNLPEGDRIELQRTAITAYPRLINYDQGEELDKIIDDNGDQGNGNGFSPDIDAQMQAYFAGMWNESTPVEDIVSVLCTLKSSKDPNEQDLFACMVYGLFDEYPCFGQYPQKALTNTALVFGCIIDMKLLSNIALQVAISMVLEGVREYRSDDLMFKFGLQALVRFQGRLEEWGRLCETLLEIPGLKGTEIYPILEDITRRRDEGTEDAEVARANGDAADDFLAPDPGIPEFTCLNVDPPPQDESAEDPDDEIQESLLFALNNVTERNLTEKTTSMKASIRPEHYQWLAKYLVENRIKHQSNYQPLYMDLLDEFDDATLWSAVLRSTIANSIQMLNAESTMGSSNERTLLKNLGGWLGSMTLARNHSIRYRNISFRDLLVEAKETQRLLVAIPFTCKVLASVANSVVFRPPCAWTMEILEVLIELYLFADLKLNLKFEIEVLCKALSIDHTDIEPAVIIRSRPVPDQDSLPNALADGLDAFADTSLIGFNRRMGDRFPPAAIIPEELASVLKYNYPTPLADPALQEQIRSLLTEATERAVADIIGAVVERSVTIASIAACQIAMKDFALEPDTNKLRESAHTAVRSLAGSLAAVTCKEPLRNQMSTNVHQLRGAIHESLLPTGYMQMFVNDNLDAVCGVVEKAAADASVEEIDVQLEEAGAIRERQGSDFGQTRQVSHWSSFIPAPYKLAPGGLTREQLAIYDDFDRNARGTLSHALNPTHDGNRQMQDVLQDQFVPTFSTNEHVPSQGLPHHRLSEPPRNQPMVNGFTNGPNNTSVEDRVADAVNALFEAATKMADLHSLEDLLSSGQVQQELAKLSELLESDVAQISGTAALAGAKAIGKLLHSAGVPSHLLELLARVLSSVCRTDRSENTIELVMNWCNDLGNRRFLNTDVTSALLRAKLIDKQRLDLSVASGLIENRPESFVFLRDLVDKALLTPRPFLFRSDLANSITTLSQCVLADRSADIAKDIIDRLGGASVLPDNATSQGKESDEDQCSYMFEEWVKFQANIDQSFVPTSFIHQLHEQRMFADQDRLASFLKAGIKACIQTCEMEESLQSAKYEESTLKSDALARLVVLMVEFQPKVNGSITGSKLEWLETTLTCIVMIFVQVFKQGNTACGPRLFFRLFSALAFELPTLGSLGLDDRHAPLAYLAKSLSLLEPSKFPAFAFSSLALISHRTLLPALVRDSGEAGRELYCQMLNSHIAHVGVMMNATDVRIATKDYYRGLVRLLLVLHHDFPDFVADYAYQMLSVVPPVCSQMRELIVTASPSTLADCPEPFMEGLKIETLPDGKWPPRILGDFNGPINRAGLDNVIATLYNKKGSVSSVVDAIIRATEEHGHLHKETTTSIDTGLLDALLITLPQRSIEGQHYLSFSMEDDATTSVLMSLIERLDMESRYYLLSSMANHLRFPNSYTAFYSQMFLHFFRSSELEPTTQMDIQQQILRVLMERIVPQRPQSWGLIKTLVDLLRSGNSKVFELPIVKAPEIEQMLGHLLERATYRSAA